jgi:NhaA family Na+:H+ antiporter
VVGSIKRFIGSESAAGVALVLAAAIAIGLSNSALAPWYRAAVAWPVPSPVPVGWGVAHAELSKPLALWVNDLWMAVFFFLVGLEIKREVLRGELATLRQAALPCAAALGGMAVPAALYAAINHADPVAGRGWAIPMATDIAFALGILMLLGARVPASLKVFLTAVAILDDLGAIVVIAVCYTAHLDVPMLGAALLGAGVLYALNRAGVRSLAPYAGVGLVVWFCVLGSGVHPTLAGVATAMAVPLSDARGGSPLEDAEHALHPWVAFLVLPAFAFVNAGVALDGVSLDLMAHGVPLGVVLGLVVGKPLGVFGGSMLVARLGVASLPSGATLRQFLGVCVLCGIGFTMSLFIGALAFAEHGTTLQTQVKLGVLLASLVSGALGATVLVMWQTGRDASPGVSVSAPLDDIPG